MKLEITALDRAFAPRAVAVYGASDRRLESQGARIGGEMLRHGYESRVSFVNPRPQTIFDVPTVATACDSDLAEELDFALIAVPRASVADAVEDCIRARIPVAMITSAGFAEVDDDGANLQRSLVGHAVANGLRLLGPNCMGMLSMWAGFHASQPRLTAPPEPGAVSVLAQSGSVGVEILDQIGQSGLGVDVWVTVGNCADLGPADLLRYLSKRESTRVIACYLESIGDVADLRAALAEAREANTEVVLLKGAAFDRGAQVAASHTGAMASADKFVDVLARESGVVRVETVREVAQAVSILSTVGRVRGNVAVVAESGGHAVLAADACERNGIRLAELAAQTTADLRGIVAELGVVNPIDMTPFARGPERERQILETIARDPAVDCIVLLDRTDWRADTDSAAEWRATAVETIRATRALVPVVQDGSMTLEVRRALAASGVAVTRDGETVWRSLARVMAASPSFEPCHTEAPTDERSIEGPDILDAGRTVELLMEGGLRLVDRAFVDTPEEARAVAEAMGYPVVVKGVVPGVGHKTELGLVHLNLHTEGQLLSALGQLDAVMSANGGGRIEVQKQIVDGLVELMVGVIDDAAFGPHVMVGRGGVWAEYEDDRVWARAPVSVSEALGLVDELRLAPAVFGGARGVCGDRAAVAEQVSRLSHLAVERRSEIAEVELNPLIVSESGAVAVDYMLRLQV